MRPIETVLQGDLDDAALFALIDRIGALGLVLLEVRRFTTNSGLHRPEAGGRSERGEGREG